MIPLIIFFGAAVQFTPKPVVLVDQPNPWLCLSDSIPDWQPQPWFEQGDNVILCLTLSYESS